MNRIPVINMTATGRNIMRLRMNAGMSVAQLQTVFGFSTPQAIYKWQKGAAMPTLDNMVVLAAVFGVTIDEILIFQDESQLRIIA
ncbi:MAG: helix-turn-helix domain-containing protein [Oscillospiraceae bacterium]|nr:helix-turn-helix domain-containing protein [Oscillospiraceae bacterium]